MFNLTPIDDTTIRALAPAAFTAKAAPDRSDRYALVHTPDVINELRAMGYRPTHAQQDKPTRRDPRFVRHMVRFAHDATLQENPKSLLKDLGNVVPQVLFWNSHNGRTMARIALGFYRLVCLNGLVVGENTAVYALRHIGNIKEQLQQALALTDEHQRVAVERMGAWRKRKLRPAEVINFAERAAQLRFGERAGAYAAEDIARPQRDEDAPQDLWHTFNRVQENLTRGGLHGRSANGRAVQSRALRGLTMDLQFNRGLWALADEFAQAA